MSNLEDVIDEILDDLLDDWHDGADLDKEQLSLLANVFGIEVESDD